MKAVKRGAWLSLASAIIGTVGIAGATDVCCNNTENLTNPATDPPCSAGSIRVCVYGYVIEQPGQKRSGTLTDPLCNTYTPGVGEVTTAPCGTPPLSGWVSIGSLGGDPEQCCWVPLQVWLDAEGWEQTVTGYMVLACDGDDC